MLREKFKAHRAQPAKAADHLSPVTIGYFGTPFNRMIVEISVISMGASFKMSAIAFDLKTGQALDVDAAIAQVQGAARGRAGASAPPREGSGEARPAQRSSGGARRVSAATSGPARLWPSGSRATRSPSSRPTATSPTTTAAARSRSAPSKYDSVFLCRDGFDEREIDWAGFPRSSRRRCSPRNLDEEDRDHAAFNVERPARVRADDDRGQVHELQVAATASRVRRQGAPGEGSVDRAPSPASRRCGRARRLRDDHPESRQCAKIDWYELGVKRRPRRLPARTRRRASRGLQGREGRAGRAAATCKGASWASAKYCQPDNAFRDGLAGNEYRGGCNATFARNHAAALRVTTLRRARSSATAATSAGAKRRSRERPDVGLAPRAAAPGSRELYRNRDGVARRARARPAASSTAYGRPASRQPATPAAAAPAAPPPPPKPRRRRSPSAAAGTATGTLIAGGVTVPLRFAYMFVAPDALDNLTKRRRWCS